jgi:hypothetical protein
MDPPWLHTAAIAAIITAAIATIISQGRHSAE